MLKKVFLICAFLFFTAAPAVFANDGGAYPDYEGYVTYSVTTDCKGIGIGEEITFKLILHNNINVEFDIFHMGSVFWGSSVDWETEEYFWSKFSPLEPYSTKEIVFTYTVPEDVYWYENKGEYYIDLCPSLVYSINQEYNYKLEELGLPYDFFQNMNEPEPIPIKLTNVYDGGCFIDFQIIDENQYFVYSDRYPLDYRESYTYFGEYEGGISNYLSIENISDYSFDVVSIDGYERLFEIKDFPLILDSKEKIIIEDGYTKLRLPDEIPEYEHVRCSMLFKDTDGNYYGTEISRDYKTILYEAPPIEVTVNKIADTEDGNQLVNISVKNVSDKAIDEFFVYYGVEFPETKDELFNNVIRKSIDAGETWEQPSEIEIYIWKSQNIYSDTGYLYKGSYYLRIGYWIDNFLCYWEMPIFFLTDEDVCLYKSDDFAYGTYEDVNDLVNDIEVFDMSSALRAAWTYPALATPTPAAELPDTPMPSAEYTPESGITVQKSISYIIPSWVYIAVAGAATLAAALIAAIRRRK